LVVSEPAGPVVTVSAPGKLMVSGEYAVLEGAPAVVAAVDRRAFARLALAPGKDEVAAIPAEARAAFRHAQQAVGTLRGQPRIDVSNLRAQGLKLGLGSSAAAAAAAAGLVFASHGRDLNDNATRHAVFQAALQGHRDISPQGSGADVAAAVHGGFLKFRRVNDVVEVEPLTWPTGWRSRVAWTGEEARTSSFLERVSALASKNPERYRALMSRLCGEAETFVAAMTAADLSSVLTSVMKYGHAMDALGQAAGVPIVTDSLRRVAELAERAGGAAKPSGAGGGDVAWALFPDVHAEQRFVELCSERKVTLLSIELGAPGVRTEGDLDGEAA
jgi:phosphomevalonate kinase